LYSPLQSGHACTVSFCVGGGAALRTVTPGPLPPLPILFVLLALLDDRLNKDVVACRGPLL
jgi:hypothetical protein